jgi:signal transduction histidine kinase
LNICGLEHLFGHRTQSFESTLSWWKENLHPEDRNAIVESLQQAIVERKNNWAGNYRFRCAQGSYKYVFDRAYVVYQEAVPVQMIGAMQDIDELTQYRKSLEQKVAERTKALHVSLAKEKELAELKNRFVSIASHEFRTPLATIEFATGFLKSYRHRVSDDDVSQKLSTIEKQVNHMAALLEDVLVVGKTESGKIDVCRTLVRLNDLMTEVCESVERLTKYSHTIHITCVNNQTHFYTDEKLLRNILSNLLTNAIKYSPNANAVYLGCEETHDHFTFTVADKGIGIPENDLNNIFQPFTRGANAGTIAGTGLGLSIVKRTVDLLGGVINVRSKPHDTVFEVVLPKAYDEKN